MSNRIVPSLYRSVIDEVIASIKPEFDEFGVEEKVLADLHNKWQQKVQQSNVAEFSAQNESASSQQHQPFPMHMMPQPSIYPTSNHYVSQPAQPHGAQPRAGKNDAIDNRFVMNGLPSYALPALPGPQINGTSGPVSSAPTPALSYPQGAPASAARAYPPASMPPSSASPQPPKPQPRIPQVDGPSSSSSDSPSPPPAYGPRSTHPSLPPPPNASQTSTAPDDEIINSDLDDSDSDVEDEEEDTSGNNQDIVFCTYDKVARVKTKWKCVLKDGIVHINGKDYIFAKCSGEFEW